MRAVVFLVVAIIAAAAQWQHTQTGQPSQGSTSYLVYHAGSIYPVVPHVVAYRGVSADQHVDALYHPGETVPLAQVVVERAQHRIDAYGGSLDRAEFELVLELAGWPEDLRREAAAVAWCESRWSPHAVGDGGNSLGLFQLWTGWFGWAGVDQHRWSDSITNAAVALAVYRRDVALGRSGWTQWSCRP